MDNMVPGIILFCIFMGIIIFVLGAIYGCNHTANQICPTCGSRIDYDYEVRTFKKCTKCNWKVEVKDDEYLDDEQDVNDHPVLI